MSEAYSYSASAIAVKKGLDGIRQRPEMYIDATDTNGIFHLAVEVTDNSIDEAMVGFCNWIKVTIEEDGTVCVEDNGRGIPVDMHPEEGVSAAIVVLTNTHAGGKFDANSYKYAGGLHGVGIKCVNALSDFLELTVKRDGKIHRIDFIDGEPQSTMPIIIGECDANETGTKLRYKPSKEVFADAVYEGGYVINKERLTEYLRIKACLNPQITIELDYQGNLEVIKNDRGIIELLDLPELDETTAHLLEEPITFKGEYEHKGKERLKGEALLNAKENDLPKEVDVIELIDTEIVMMFFNRYNAGQIRSFVNNIETKNHGKHVSGMRDVLYSVVKEYAVKRLKEKKQFRVEDVLAGGCFVVNQKMQNAAFGGQTKGSLTSGKGRTAVKAILEEAFIRYLDENPEFAEKLVKKSVSACNSREKLEQARDVAEKGEIVINNKLSGKLTSCRSKNLEENELILVEGDSAGGSAKDARCKITQAILPLRGKILNIEKQDDKTVLSSEQVQMLYSAIGTSLLKDYDYSKLRYGKIIILTDADVDGLHIRSLLLTFFYRYMVDLVEKGHIYVGVPPLFKVAPKTGRGKAEYYVDQAALDAAYPNGIPSNKDLGRFKGLGEMNPDQLKETTLDKHNRTLNQIQYDPSEKERVDKMFDTLMGKNVDARREFIEKNVEFSSETE